MSLRVIAARIWSLVDPFWRSTAIATGTFIVDHAGPLLHAPAVWMLPRPPRSVHAIPICPPREAASSAKAEAGLPPFVGTGFGVVCGSDDVVGGLDLAVFEARFVAVALVDFVADLVEVLLGEVCGADAVPRGLLAVSSGKVGMPQAVVSAIRQMRRALSVRRRVT